MYEFSSSLSRGCLNSLWPISLGTSSATSQRLLQGMCRFRSSIFFLVFCVFVSSLFARYNFYSYAIEQLLSCRVRWHPRPTPALGMSQQGEGDILTSGSAWVLYVGTSIVIEDLNSFLVVRQYHASTYPLFLQARSLYFGSGVCGTFSAGIKEKPT